MRNCKSELQRHRRLGNCELSAKFTVRLSVRSLTPLANWPRELSANFTVRLRIRFIAPVTNWHRELSAKLTVRLLIGSVTLLTNWEQRTVKKSQKYQFVHWYRAVVIDINITFADNILRWSVITHQNMIGMMWRSRHTVGWLDWVKKIIGRTTSKFWQIAMNISVHVQHQVLMY